MTSAGPRPFLIDSDTASDDAIAIMMALRRPDVSVKAITTVSGNVPMDLATKNALFTVEHVGADVPVYAGVSKPILRPLRSAQFVHGQDGMGDLGLVRTNRTAADGHAVDVMVEMARRYAGELTLVTMGPLSNVAVALLRAPEMASQLKRLVVMGGIGQGHGNVSPVAEYNVWCDPEAARVVFNSGAPIEMVGWDISRTFAVISPAEQAAFRASGSRSAQLAMDINVCVAEFCRTETQLDGFDLPDPAAMAVALDPSIVTQAIEANVDVEVGEGPSCGQTLIDYLRRKKGAPQSRIVLGIDRQRFLQLVADGLEVQLELAA